MKGINHQEQEFGSEIAVWQIGNHEFSGRMDGAG
jgi:hypothetical protein